MKQRTINVSLLFIILLFSQLAQAIGPVAVWRYRIDPSIQDSVAKILPPYSGSNYDQYLMPYVHCESYSTRAGLINAPVPLVITGDELAYFKCWSSSYLYFDPESTRNDKRYQIISTSQRFYINDDKGYYFTKDFYYDPWGVRIEEQQYGSNATIYKDSMGRYMTKTVAYNNCQDFKCDDD